MGLTMTARTTAYRANIVTLSEEQERYKDKMMLTTRPMKLPPKEADQLIKAIEAHFGTAERHFYTGVSYRHCLLWENAPNDYDFMRPHDILGQCIGYDLPQGPGRRAFSRFDERKL